jgi:hypothetical protein
LCKVRLATDSVEAHRFEQRPEGVCEDESLVKVRSFVASARAEPFFFAIAFLRKIERVFIKRPKEFSLQFYCSRPIPPLAKEESQRNDTITAILASKRSAWDSLVIGLLVFATLGYALAILNKWSESTQPDWAHAINVAGRQGMLSQKIVQLQFAQLAQPTARTQEKLERHIEYLALAHTYLLRVLGLISPDIFFLARFTYGETLSLVHGGWVADRQSCRKLASRFGPAAVLLQLPTVRLRN